MKLDKLLEQMMVMQQQHQQSVHQQQQQMDNDGAEFQQNAQQTEHDEGRQFHQQCADSAQNSSGTTNGTNACFQSSNNGQSFGEMLASTNSAKYKKSDEFLHPLHGAGIGQTSPQSQPSPQQQSLAPAVGMTETQHLAFLSAFLRANLPMSPLSAFSTSSLQPQQILAVPNIPSPAPQQIVPLSKEVASQGLFAVGGCRPCQKTFTTRLELIHHCVDHFPATFYSFEERSAPNGEHSPPQTTKNGNKNSAPNGSGLHQLDDTFVEASQKMDILGQLAGLLALNENGSPSPGSSAADLPIHGIPNSLFTNFFKSFVPMPLQQLATAENANNLDTNGPSEDVREQQRGKSVSLAPNSNHPSSRPSPSSNSSKANSAVRKRQIHQEKAANSSRESAGKGRTGDGPSTSSVGSNKNQRKNNGGERSRNGGGSGRTVPTKTASSTASSLPGLSELPYHMCPHCCLTFAETSAFRAHLSVHESEVTAHAIPTTIAPFMAPPALTSVANLVVTTSGGGAETVASSQQQQTTLKCLLCEMKFVNSFRLSEHMRLHSAHMCSQCQKTFMTAFDLNLHMGTHTGFTYDCKDCGKCFPCRKTLAEHNRSHRMILSGGGGSASPEPPKKAKTSLGLLTISQDRENSPDFGGPNGDSGNEKRRLRVAKRGEKSRRNATLVAVESTAASPPIALPPVSSASSSWPSSPTNALLLSSLTAAMCGGDGWTPGIANAAQEHPNASASTDKPGGDDDVLEREEEKNGTGSDTNEINGERGD